MAVVQSTYVETIRPAVAGGVANERNWDADTRQCETAAGIAFGVAVGQGVADKGAVIGGALTAFVGITVRDITLVHAAADVDKYVQYENMCVLTDGDIWVTTDGTVVIGGPVHYNATTGVLGDSGGSGPIPGARWMSSVTGVGLAKVRLTSANHA